MSGTDISLMAKLGPCFDLVNSVLSVMLIILQQSLNFLQIFSAILHAHGTDMCKTATHSCYSLRLIVNFPR